MAQMGSYAMTIERNFVASIWWMARLICRDIDLFGHAALPLFLALTDANDRHQVMFDGSGQLFRLTSSSVSPKYWRRSEWPRITCLTPMATAWKPVSGKRALLRKVHILSAHQNVGALPLMHHRRQIYGRGADHDLSLGLVFDQRQERMKEALCSVGVLYIFQLAAIRSLRILLGISLLVFLHQIVSTERVCFRSTRPAARTTVQQPRKPKKKYPKQPIASTKDIGLPAQPISQKTNRVECGDEAHQTAQREGDQAQRDTDRGSRGKPG